MDADGNIFARGAQDMKSVGMQYLEAIRLLKSSGWTPRRTVHVAFVPDEETGGKAGMHALVESDLFPTLNVRGLRQIWRIDLRGRFASAICVRIDDDLNNDW